MNSELALRQYTGHFQPATRYSFLDIPLTRWFVLGIIVFSVGMFESFLYEKGAAANSSGTFALQIPWGCIYLITAIWTLFHARMVAGLAWHSKLLLVPPCLALLSSQWAQESGPVERRSIALLCTYLIGALIAITCDLRLQVKLICVAMLMAVALSIGVELLAPGWVPVVEEHAGSWNGAFPHKNMMARIMVLSVLAFLCYRPLHAFARGLRWIGISASLALIVLSRSATAALIMVALLICFFLLKGLNRRGRSFVLVVAGCAALAITGSLLLAKYSDALLSLVGKDSTGTGRTVLWKVSLLSIAKRPLLGYGFNAFWRQNNEALTARTLIPNHFDAPHAHNGYLETALQLGIIGLAFICINLGMLLFGAIKRYRSSGAPGDFWPIMLVLFLLLYNVTESSMMVENVLTWILFTAAAFRITLEQSGLLSQAAQPSVFSKTQVAD